MSKLHRLFAVLMILVVLVALAACGDDENPLDGDAESDGDGTIDGDLPDGDAVIVPDGDEPDGDEDGDVDGDVDPIVDGDVDSDVDSDGDLDGEADLPLPECVNPVPARVLNIEPDETFDFGPYLMQPQATSIVVMWHTLQAEDGTVIYGLGDEPDVSVSHEGNVTIHEVRLDGLTPNTRYSYKVKSGERESAIHHFVTAPGPNQGFSVTLWGDSQDNPDIFGGLVDHMTSLNPYFALGLGDHVSEGGEFDQFKTKLFGPARGMFHELGFFAAIGNHARNHQNWYDLMSFPYPGDDPQHESYYSFTYGNAFFLVIDTDKPYFPLADLHTDISAFVAEQVASPEAQAATWRFAISHVPGYAEAWGDAVCESYGGDLAIRGWLYPLLNEYGFHAHFSGHMHGYERGKSENLVTIIAGGGGGGLDAWCVDLPQVSVVNYVHHHLLMDVGCDTVKISAYDEDGTQFDWVEITADTYGQIVDEGPMDNLPDPPIDPDSPSYEGDR